MGRHVGGALVLLLAFAATVCVSPAPGQVVRVPLGNQQAPRPLPPPMDFRTIPDQQLPPSLGSPWSQVQQQWFASQPAEYVTGATGYAGDAGSVETRPEVSQEALQAEAIADDLRTTRATDLDGLPVSGKLRRADWP